MRPPGPDRVATEGAASPKRSRPVIIFAGCWLLLISLGWVDYITGYELGFFVFYSAPVGLAAWYLGRWPGIAMAFGATITWWLADAFAGAKYASSFSFWWNSAIHFAAFLINAITIAKIRLDLRQRDKLAAELEAARQALRGQVEEPRKVNPAPPTEHDKLPPSFAAPSARLMSLDALRGFDMFWIIGGGAIFSGLAKALGGPLEALKPQFEHVRWEGLHAWDLIWPLFMFIVGVSIPLSIEKRQATGSSKRSLYFHALRRAVILFVLGIVVQGRLLSWDLAKLRPCYSVLHGIAAGYLIAFAIANELRPKMQGAMIAVFLLLYWAALALVPVPGIGAGVLTPEGNLAAWIDRLILGRFHYGDNTWFLSYPGFASSVLLGVLAGRLLMSPVSEKTKVLTLIGAGAACIALGLIWSLAFPIIKLLWTSSFVLVSGGFGFLMLALFYWLIDVKGCRRWAFFFTVIGMNSVAAYVAIMLFNFKQIGNIFVGGVLPRLGPWDSLVEASAAFAAIWLLLYWMYRTRTFLKL